MRFLRRLWSTRKSELYREKVLELAAEFMLEASVLSGVLGVLESAIALRDWPTRRMMSFSLGFAGLFFLLACILQALRVPYEETVSSKRAPTSSGEEASDD